MTVVTSTWAGSARSAQGDRPQFRPQNSHDCGDAGVSRPGPPSERSPHSPRLTQLEAGPSPGVVPGQEVLAKGTTRVNTMALPGTSRPHCWGLWGSQHLAQSVAALAWAPPDPGLQAAWAGFWRWGRPQAPGGLVAGERLSLLPRPPPRIPKAPPPWPSHLTEGPSDSPQMVASPGQQNRVPAASPPGVHHRPAGLPQTSHFASLCSCGQGLGALT